MLSTQKQHFLLDSDSKNASQLYKIKEELQNHLLNEIGGMGEEEGEGGRRREDGGPTQWAELPSYS